MSNLLEVKEPTIDEKKMSESADTLAQRPWTPPSSLQILESDLPHRIADSLDEQLGCAVWLVRRNARGAIVEVHTSRTAAEIVVTHESLGNIASDACQSAIPIAAGCKQSLPVSASVILEQVLASHKANGAISVAYPLTKHDGHSWIVTLMWRSNADDHEWLLKAAWLDLNGKTLGNVLEAWTLAKEGGYWLSLLDRYTQWRKIPRRWILTGVVGFALLMCLPIPYRPQRDCVLEPTTKRFVASPIEGVLASITVRPGEHVKHGQILGHIDDGPLKREMAAAEAELQTANKKRDVALATRASGDLRLAQLECQQIELKIETLRDRLERLEIISPAEGVIVQGDWYGNEGMPVTLGQTLFEIAPMDRMTAEIHLKAEDLPWIQVGAASVMRSESTGTKSWTGKLTRLEPHAEIIDDQAVYIAEMEVENDHGLFRPGMKAQAVVDAGNHTIGWLLFHKPYHWLINQWVW